MSLIQAQKDFIKSAIDHLIDFPSDLATLSQEISKLVEALTKSVEPSHDYYFLRKCIVDTKETMLGIEKFNADVKLGEIQNYIIELTLEQVKTAAGNNAAVMQNLANKINLVLPTLIPQENNETPFKTEPPPSSNQLPWQMIYDEGQIHSSRLYVDQDGTVFLEAKTNFPLFSYKVTAPLSHMKYVDPEIPNPEFNFLYSLISNAKIEATRLMKNFVLKYLYDSYLIHDYLYNNIARNKHANQILTHEYYLQQIINRTLYPVFLTTISKNASDSLVDPSVVSLVKKHEVTLNQALALTPTQTQLVSTFFLALKNNRIDIHDILTTKDEQSKILLTPLIINFINQEPPKLSFKKARKLPSFLKQIFTSPLYMDYFSREDIDWEKLCGFTENDCEFILDPKIAALIINDVLDLKNINNLMPELFITLARPKINKLLTDKKLSLPELEDLSLNKIALIESHPYLSEWLAQDVIKVNDIDTRNLLDFYSKVYSERLIAFVKKKPFKIHELIDQPSLIKGEILAASFHAKVNAETLREKVIAEFIRKCKPIFDEYILSIIDPQARKNILIQIHALQQAPISRNVNSIDNANCNNSATWSGVLLMLINHAHEILFTPSMLRKRVVQMLNQNHENCIFDRRNHVTDEFINKIVSYCENLIGLTDVLMERQYINPQTFIHTIDIEFQHNLSQKVKR